MGGNWGQGQSAEAWDEDDKNHIHVYSRPVYNLIISFVCRLVALIMGLGS